MERSDSESGRRSVKDREAESPRISIDARRKYTRENVRRVGNESSSPKEKKAEAMRRGILRNLGYRIQHDDAGVLEISKSGLLFRIRYEQDEREFARGGAGKVVNITAIRAFGDEATIMIWYQGEVTFPRDADVVEGSENDDEEEGGEAFARANYAALVNAREYIGELVEHLN